MEDFLNSDNDPFHQSNIPVMSLLFRQEVLHHPDLQVYPDIVYYDITAIGMNLQRPYKPTGKVQPQRLWFSAINCDTP